MLSETGKGELGGRPVQIGTNENEASLDKYWEERVETSPKASTFCREHGVSKACSFSRAYESLHKVRIYQSKSLVVDRVEVARQLVRDRIDFM